MDREHMQKIGRIGGKAGARYFLEIDGVRKSLKDWCKERGLNYHTAYSRWLRHLSAEEILAPSKGRGNK